MSQGGGDEPLHGHPNVGRHVALALLVDEPQPVVGLGVPTVRRLLIELQRLCVCVCVCRFES